MRTPATIPIIAPVVMPVFELLLLPALAVLVEAEEEEEPMLRRERVAEPEENAWEPPGAIEVWVTTGTLDDLAGTVTVATGTVVATAAEVTGTAEEVTGRTADAEVAGADGIARVGAVATAVEG